MAGQPVGWDSDVALVEMERRHLRSVLERDLAGALTAEEVEEWANAVDVRDDIGHEAAAKPLLKEAVHELANPMLTRPLSPPHRPGVATTTGRPPGHHVN